MNELISYMSYSTKTWVLNLLEHGFADLLISSPGLLQLSTRTNGLKLKVILMPHIYPHAFLKKRRGYCNRLRPSVRYAISSLTIEQNSTKFGM